MTHKAKQAMLRLGVVPPPFQIQIDLTDSCNFRCPTCSKWKVRASPEELDLDAWGRVLAKISDVSLLRKISVTGGEPFMRADLLAFLELAKHQGLEIVLITNGWFLDVETLDRLESIGIGRLMVSLNSLREPIHDETRGKPGSHARVMAAIEAWRTQPRAMDLCLSTAVMEANCGELIALLRFVEEKGLTGIIFQVLAADEAHYPFARDPRMPELAADWYTHNPRWVRSADVLQQQLEELRSMQQAGLPVLNPPSQLRNFALYYEDPDAIRKLPCLGTLSRMYIDPFGDMRVCYGYPPIGNALRDDPRKVWRSDAARRMRRDSTHCTRLCRMLNNNL
jgi:MoaA/NifB/PqqE/SkfB family radical SAM enzyme